MGHTRLGDLPKTRKWQEVVALLEVGAGAAQLANATLSAAERGFMFAAGDAGVVESVWLLMQVPLAARSDDFAGALRRAGLPVSDHPTLFDITAALSNAVDSRLPNNKDRSDLGEMAQNAAAEAIGKVVGERLPGLFGVAPEDVQRTCAELGTSKQFGTFGRAFFGRLTEKYLEYFLSRAVSYHVGEGRRFNSLAEHSEFSQALRLHCQQASRIVEDFCGGWFSKTNWEKGGIPREEAAKFTRVAMKKVCSELRQGATVHAE
jgi:hypothetical protein